MGHKPQRINWLYYNQGGKYYAPLFCVNLLDKENAYTNLADFQ